ncbi:hypothetical protein L596_013173 [Steinernema carpocapsae]|uniref:Acid phosphatase n=1 Tax=Steinernema carpocapsae TaxID=34508 RepID=A0A4U5NZC9_STECR|nr:hypothetical protein L596_013173 [Steinernema carpocapsae]
MILRRLVTVDVQISSFGMFINFQLKWRLKEKYRKLIIPKTLNTATAIRTDHIRSLSSNEMTPYLLFLLFWTCVPICSGSKLLQIQAIWRHGDRTPTGTYPTDPNQASAWPVPWGELTTRGMWQQYTQGLKLKQEYVDKLTLISSNYKSSEIYVRSTDFDRTLASAYSNLAGFYSDSNGTYPNGTVWPARWTPIPVHTTSKDKDELLFIVGRCPRRAELRRAQNTDSRVLKLLKDNSDLIDLIQEEGKIKIDGIYKLYEFWNILLIERLHNLPWPEWITEEVYQRIYKIAGPGFGYTWGGAAFGIPESVELTKVSFGYLTTHMIEKMKKRLNGTDKTLYYAYSAHDANVDGFLRTLGAKEALVGELAVDYAATVVLELWEMEKGEPHVRLRFSANSETPFVTATDKISGCTKAEFCPLNTFIGNRKEYLIYDEKKACASKTDRPFERDQVNDFY